MVRRNGWRFILLLAAGAVLALLFVGTIPALGGGAQVAAAEASPPINDVYRRSTGDDGSTGDVLSEYVTVTSWSTRNVTYSIDNCPSKMDCGLALQQTREAVEAWDAVSGLTLDEVPEDGQIKITWQSGSHGDDVPFDGLGGILGHAYFPYSWLGNLAGDVHLDDDEPWVAGTPTNYAQVHLKTAVMHEVGHALGLGHSENPAALMWAEYDRVRGLHQDDIAAVQSLYGPPEGTAPPPSGNVFATATTIVRVRSGPGTGYRSLGVVFTGSRVPVLGKDRGGQWIYIEYNAGERGWMAGWLTNIEGNLAAAPVLNPDGTRVDGGGIPSAPDPGSPAGPADPNVPDSAVTAAPTVTLRIRSGPGQGYRTLDLLARGTAVPVIGRNASGSWIRIDHNGLTGWVAAWLCNVNGNLNDLPVIPAP